VIGVDDDYAQSVCTEMMARGPAEVRPISTGSALGRGVYALEDKIYYNAFFNVYKDLRMMGPWETAGVRRPQEEQEEIFGRQLGIDNDTMVILYDAEGWDATRLFWELRQLGHDKVALIYGGWPEWNAQNLPVVTEVPKIEPAVFVGNYLQSELATASYIQVNLGNPNLVLLDTRPPAQFKGAEKFPQAKVGGHIAGAVNAFTLANWENKTYLKNPADLEAMYAELGVTRDKEIVLYCNTGYFAANSYFILKALGFPKVRVYDYSWAEYNNKPFLPKILGSAK
jgi:thiosulfate/3-mercaptopyruvate sulfurtransferase